MLAGAVPLFPYMVPLADHVRLAWSIALTLLSLFGVGVIRAMVTADRWWRTGLEMLLLGGLALVAVDHEEAVDERGPRRVLRQQLGDLRLQEGVADRDSIAGELPRLQLGRDAARGDVAASSAAVTVSGVPAAMSWGSASSATRAPRSDGPCA